jgi:hypothetical protein
MDYFQMLRIAVVSASDVQAERDTIPRIVDYLNNGIAKDRGLRLEVSRWETEAYPIFHAEGPQGAIDEVLRIEDCDLVIAIFWKRFGTPVKDARSGTEHELRRAHRAWKKTGRPQIMLYFNERLSAPRSKADAEQWGQVLEFRQKFSREGLWWSYRSKAQFERLLRDHLTQFIRARFPLAFPLNESKLLTRQSSEVSIPISPVRQSGFALNLNHIIRRCRPSKYSFKMASVVTFCVSILLLAFLLTDRKRNEIVQSPPPAPLLESDVGDSNTETVVLEAYVALRGLGTVATNVRVLPNSVRYVCLQLKLPKGEDAEFYNISLREAYDDRILFTLGWIKRINGTISIVLNQQWISKGRYRIAVYQNGEAPIYYLFNVSNDDLGSPHK